MFDIGWSEMLLLGIIGLLVVGPRELPSMLRTLGQYIGRVRHMAQLFRHNINELADEIDVQDGQNKLTNFIDEPNLFDAQKDTKADENDQ